MVDAFVPVRGETRRTTVVVDESTGDSTVFNEPGPTVAPEEWAAFLAAYRNCWPARGRSRCAAACRRALPVGAYADLVRVARAAGVYVLLDTSGEALRRGIAARPDAVKPNGQELAQLTGLTDRRARPARRGGAGRGRWWRLGGPGGLLAVTDAGTWRAAPPGRLAGNPAGAGEARRWPACCPGSRTAWPGRTGWPGRRRCRRPAFRRPVAGEFDPAAYDDLLPRVAVDARDRAA